MIGSADLVSCFSAAAAGCLCFAAQPPVNMAGTQLLTTLEESDCDLSIDGVSATIPIPIKVVSRNVADTHHDGDDGFFSFGVLGREIRLPAWVTRASVNVRPDGIRVTALARDEDIGLALWVADGAWSALPKDSTQLHKAGGLVTPLTAVQQSFREPQRSEMLEHFRAAASSLIEDYSSLELMKAALNATVEDVEDAEDAESFDLALQRIILVVGKRGWVDPKIDETEWGPLEAYMLTWGDLDVYATPLGFHADSQGDSIRRYALTLFNESDEMVAQGSVSFEANREPFARISEILPLMFPIPQE
jgi:hypothetical protein